MVKNTIDLSYNAPSSDKKEILEDNNAFYPVMEHFYTIQGEGYWTGVAAYFIRLGGCDVGCVWCDVKESWDINAHPKLDLAQLLHFVQENQAQRVVITGGEPYMHNLDALTSYFRTHQIISHIETSGAHKPSGQFDWVCLSPKKFKFPCRESYALANELKVIVYHKSDFQFAEQQAQLCPASTLLYLQPEWSKKESLFWIIDYVKQNPKWRISLQTHKFMDIP